MFKKLLNKELLRNQKGLTLIELLAVIVILAIVAAIAVPAIGNIIENTRYNATKADAVNVLNAANLYFTEQPDESSVTVATLKTEKYLDNAGKFNDTNTATAATVTKVSGGANTLTAPNVNYSGNKNISFSGATLDDINGDDQKGSGSPTQIPESSTPTPSGDGS